MRTCHFTSNKKQKRAFYLAVIRSIFEHCSVIWHPISPNQIVKFDSIQKKAVKWIFGQQFEHYNDQEYLAKLNELNILPIKLKFALNDLVLYYKIINFLVPINLPEHFTFIKPGDVRCTRNTSDIIEKKDVTRIKCCIKPTCESFRTCFLYRTMGLWNSIPYSIRQQSAITKFKTQVTKFLLSANLDWPD